MFGINYKVYLLVPLFCIIHQQLHAQAQYAIDTTFYADTACHAKFYPFWYLKAKRAESSQQLAHDADALIPASARDTAQNGFINLQFLINCKGIASGYRLSQTDNHYKSFIYPVAMVNAIYHFVKGLRGWKPAIYEQDPVNYKAYLAFKIKNGHVVEVSP